MLSFSCGDKKFTRLPGDALSKSGGPGTIAARLSWLFLHVKTKNAICPALH
jgi:hypothetical protein